MSANRVKTATSADWAFMDDPDAIKAIEGAAKKAARLFEHVEYPDAYHDALLYVAVRPERYARAADTGDYRSFGSHVYDHAIRQTAVTESNRRNEAVYIDALDGEVW